MGMGAFVCGSLAVNFNLPFWITIPAGGLGGAILGAIFGIPALRIKGFYLAMTTIAAQVIFPLIIMHLPDSWFGGAIGLNIEPAKLGGITFNSDTSLYYLIIITAVVMIFFAFNLVRGRTGRAFVATTTSRPKLWGSIFFSTRRSPLPSEPCMPAWPAACGRIT
jgi:branched-chain amino acid transport system permease protein